MLLQEPEFEPKNDVDNTEYEATHRIRTSITGKQMEMTEINQMEHYHVNMASYILLGKWFGITGILIATILTIIAFNFIGGTQILFKEYYHMDVAEFV